MTRPPKPPEDPKRQSATRGADTARKARLAAQLRANLKKRKDQSRQRRDDTGGNTD